MSREPLVPYDVDLRDFPYMPIDIVRLFGSDFHAQTNDAAWRAGMTLWLKSYHQVPAASVPDDDVALARLAEFGRDVKAWRKVKSGAMRGWVKCSDGRFYHPVVAEKAIESWIERLNQRKSSGAGNAKRYGTQFDPTEIETSIQDCLRRLSELNANSRMLSKRLPKPPSRVPTSIPPGDIRDELGSPDAGPDELPSGSQERRGEARLGEAAAQLTHARAKRLEPHDDGPDEWRQTMAACNDSLGDSVIGNGVFGPIMLLIEKGITLRQIQTVLRSEAAARRARNKPAIRTWSTWADIIVERLDAAPKVAVKPAARMVRLRHDLDVPFANVEAAVRRWQQNGFWNPAWEEPPGQPGCLVPRDVLEELGALDGPQTHRGNGSRAAHTVQTKPEVAA